MIQAAQQVVSNCMAVTIKHQEAQIKVLIRMFLQKEKKVHKQMKESTIIPILFNENPIVLIVFAG